MHSVRWVESLPCQHVGAGERGCRFAARACTSLRCRHGSSRPGMPKTPTREPSRSRLILLSCPSRTLVMRHGVHSQAK